MNRIYPKLILAVLLILVQFALKAQVLQTVRSAFDAYQQNHLQEKLFVHTDKEKYIAGELLWFKIYEVNAGNNQPLSLSKVAYIEVLGANNQPLVQAKVMIEQGRGNGSMVLPAEFNSGGYKLRAYTNWMQNFGPVSFFEKQLVLVNPLENKDKIHPEKTSVDLQFFAEGGDMVEGLPATIAFKAIGADGKGKALKGAVLNQKNDTVARFETLKFGMGRFAFVPQAGQSYKAVAGTGNEKMVKDLSLARPQGYTLLLEDKGATLNLTINTNLNVNEVYLFVHNGQNTAIAELATVSGGKASVQIDKAKLGDGLAHFTVFNANAQAVAERLYFKKPSQKLKLEAKSDLSAYSARSKVNIDFIAQNEVGKGIPADLSVSVRRLDSLQGIDQQDIQSYLWLSSELKGTIESPSYYFQDGNDANMALDNLLLTQGWRRFAWTEVMQKGLPSFKFTPELQGHLITGKLSKNGTAVKYANVYLSIPAKGRRFYESLTDVNGNFTFNVPQLFGVNELVIQTDRTDTTSLISIANPFAEQFTPSTAMDFQQQNGSNQDLELYNLSAQVQNSFSAQQLKRFYEANVDTSRFYGQPFRTYFLDDYTDRKSVV